MYLRILTALTMVAATTATMGFATYAYLSDTETVENLALDAGTLDLATGDVGTFTAAVGSGNFAPGDVTSGTLALTNAGSIRDGDAQGHEVVMDWKATVTETDASGGATDIAAYIQVSTLSLAGDDYLSAADGGEAITDANGNGWVDLDDLAAAGPFTGKADPGAAGTTLSTGFTFRPEAGNPLQGDSANVDFTFFLRQAAEAALQ